MEQTSPTPPRDKPQKQLLDIKRAHTQADEGPEAEVQLLPSQVREQMSKVTPIASIAHVASGAQVSNHSQTEPTSSVNAPDSSLPNFNTKDKRVLDVLNSINEHPEILKKLRELLSTLKGDKPSMFGKMGNLFSSSPKDSPHSRNRNDSTEPLVVEGTVDEHRERHEVHPGEHHEEDYDHVDDDTPLSLNKATQRIENIKTKSGTVTQEIQKSPGKGYIDDIIKQLETMNILPNGKEQDMKVMRIAILTFIREYAYDSILFENIIHRNADYNIIKKELIDILNASLGEPEADPNAASLSAATINNEGEGKEEDAEKKDAIGVGNNDLIKMLLEIIIERTSPVYTPEYFVLEKKKLWDQDIHTTSGGERTIALTIPKKPYYERIFKTVSLSTKSTSKGYYGMDYYIKPRLPSPTPSGETLSGGENLLTKKGRAERMARLKNTENSKKVTKAAVMKQLSTFSCNQSNCNSGKLIPIPEDDSLVWTKRTVSSSMSHSSAVMDQNLDTVISMLGPAHQHEADNHSNFLEISTYLWQVLRILVKDDQTKCIRIQYTGTYIYYTEPYCKTNNCAKYIKSGEYFCKPQPHKTNYIALYRDVSGEDQITNFLYGLDRNAGRYGLNNATIEISEDSKIGDAIYDEWDGEDEEPGEVDSGDAKLTNVDDIKKEMADFQADKEEKKEKAKADKEKAMLRTGPTKRKRETGLALASWLKNSTEEKKKEDAAINIQSLWRGDTNRKKLKEAKAAEDKAVEDKAAKEKKKAKFLSDLVSNQAKKEAALKIQSLTRRKAARKKLNDGFLSGPMSTLDLPDSDDENPKSNKKEKKEKNVKGKTPKKEKKEKKEETPSDSPKKDSSDDDSLQISVGGTTENNNMLKACLLSNLYTLILLLKTTSVEDLFKAFQYGNIMGSDGVPDPILKNTNITPSTDNIKLAGFFKRLRGNSRTILINPITESYNDHTEWFELCITNSTLFNNLIYRGHVNYLPIESVLGKHSIYHEIVKKVNSTAPKGDTGDTRDISGNNYSSSDIDRLNKIIKNFHSTKYKARIKQYNELYKTRYKTVNNGEGMLTNRSLKTFNSKFSFNSSYTSKELSVIKSLSSDTKPILYPDMYNLQKGISELNRSVHCKKADAGIIQRDLHQAGGGDDIQWKNVAGTWKRGKMVYGNWEAAPLDDSAASAASAASPATPTPAPTPTPTPTPTPAAPTPAPASTGTECPFGANLYLIFGNWDGFVMNPSKGGGPKKKTVSNHKKYNKNKLYMKHLQKERRKKGKKTNKRNKRSKKYTNKRRKNRN